MTLALIARPDGQVDVGLSDRVREPAIAGVVDTPAGLTHGELALLRELLDRVGTP